MESEAELAALAGKRAENLFENGRYCCSEAVLAVCNHGLNGGVDPAVCRSLAVGFCGGMGNGNGECGALAGAIMALGLFLSPTSNGTLNAKKFRRVTGEFYDYFVENFGSSCCSELIEPYAGNRKGRRCYCRTLTGVAAQECVRTILRFRPELTGRADRSFLARRVSKIAAMFQCFVHFVT